MSTIAAAELTETCRRLLRSAGSRPPDELRELLAAQSPDAVAAAARHGCAFEVRSWLPWFGAGSTLSKHVLFRLFFGWKGAGIDEFETWSALAAIGPAGFQRVTSRPESLSALLREERPALPEGEAEWLAELICEAFGQDHGPDRMDDLIVRDARSRSGLLTDYRVQEIDEGHAQHVAAPIDRDAWQTRIRPRLARPFAWRTDRAHAVAFSTMDVVTVRDGSTACFRFRVWRCHIERDSWEIQAAPEDLGDLDCAVRPMPVF